MFGAPLYLENVDVAVTVALLQGPQEVSVQPDASLQLIQTVQTAENVRFSRKTAKYSSENPSLPEHVPAEDAQIRASCAGECR